MTDIEPTVEQIEQAARDALSDKPFPKTNVVNPVNGARPYSYVEFLGQRVVFQQHDSEIKYHNGQPVYDGATDKANDYATQITDLLFAVAKDAARSILAHARTIAREAEKDATIARLREALGGLLPDFTGGLDPTEPDVVVRARAALAALGEQP